MIRLLKQIVSSEKGQALPIVLGLLVLGGLTIASGLSYTATSLKSSRLLEEDVRGIYAADAGMEDALWSLAKGMPLDPPLSEYINQMLVIRQAENKGTYTLYLGELIEPGEHSDYLEVDGEIVWDEEAEAYKYTITVTWQPESGTPVIHLEEIGARLPLDYSYQPWSAASFEDNLSTDEPEETLDALGAYMLNWEFGSPRPSVSENESVRTQIFYITGEGSQSGTYAWVVASRDDIGAAGEITGTSYKITTTAQHPENGETTAKIVADVMIEAGTAHILAWQISN
jgi:hypothetical protein